MKEISSLTIVVILCSPLFLALVAGMSNSHQLLPSVRPLTGPVELDVLKGNSRFSNSSHLLKRIRRDHHRHQCPIQPDPRSLHVQRRSMCPFDIQRDVNPQRIPDVILRSHCLCESSPCGHSGGSRCLSLVSPLKVAYLDSQLKFVISTEVIHVPVACICAAQPVGRHMSANRNIVV